MSVDVSGRVMLKWECKNPRGANGTIYRVWRRIGSAGPFEYLGHSGAKSFVDDTIPAGSGAVTYQVQASRSKTVGQKARYDISLGVTGPLPQTIIPQGRKNQIAA